MKTNPLTHEQAREYIGGFDVSEWEREHIIQLARSVREAAARPGMNSTLAGNLRRTASKYIQNHINTQHKSELKELIAAYDSIPAFDGTE